MKRSLIVAAIAAAALAPDAATAQDRPARWQRRGEATAVPVTVFHSTQSANLATGETLAAGEWLFEISHRFGLIDSGMGGFYGLDGPVVNRFGLAFAPTDRIMIGVLRSNADDNVDVSAKAKLFASRSGLPVVVGANVGVAWNTDPPVIEGYDDNESQAYAQLLVNALVGGRLALGVVPSVVRNPDPSSTETDNAFALGLQGQLYVAEMVSLFGEWVVEPHGDLEHDTGSFGIELETGGHFFKLMVSNGNRINPSQVLSGTRGAFGTNQLRFGFNITRILTF